MSVTTSQTVNSDQLQAALSTAVAGASFAYDGPGMASGLVGKYTFFVATDAQGQAALTTAAGQFVNYATNTTTIQANVQTHLGQIETWLAANPNGAILTAAQTAQLARMLVGLGRLLLNLTSTVGQAT